MVKRIAAFLMVTFLATAGFGQVRTWVSSTGVDTDPCTRELPCRTFAPAVTAVATGGEVVVLDSAGYSPVTINKSVSLISPPGIHAAIAPTSGHAITVNGPSIIVVLRGLYLNGQGGGNGISFPNGAALYLENMVISGFIGHGLDAFAPGSGVTVFNTIARRNGNNGMRFSSAGTPMRAIADTVWTDQNFQGLVSAGISLVTVRNCHSARNVQYGLIAEGPASVLNVESCVSADNGTGLFGNGTLRAAETMVVGNVTGVAHSMTGDTVSFGNNRVEGNTTDGAFKTTITTE